MADSESDEHDRKLNTDPVILLEQIFVNIINTHIYIYIKIAFEIVQLVETLLLYQSKEKK